MCLSYNIVLLQYTNHIQLTLPPFSNTTTLRVYNVLYIKLFLYNNPPGNNICMFIYVSSSAISMYIGSYSRSIWARARNGRF